MRDFACPACGQRLAVESSVCRSCSLTRTRPADGQPEMAFVQRLVGQVRDGVSAAS